MKRLCLLLPVLLLLPGCAVFAASVPEQEAPSVVVMASPETEWAAPQPETDQPTDSLIPMPKGDPSAAASGDVPRTEPAAPPRTEDPPSTDSDLRTGFQAGDTTPTWRPALAADYPADADCPDSLLLEKWLAVEGLTAADLEARSCDQLILVSAQPTDGVETVTVCYERGADGSFLPAAGLTRMAGHLGKNGLRHNRRRNTNTTPAGLWAISSAFGNDLPPEGLKLPWRQVTPDSDWVCDENSIYFNTWQERGDPTLTERWSEDVEHLEDYPELYAWACVVEFNRPPDVVPDRGCAIFLHCSEKGTGGCVGLIREDLRAVLTWLDPEKNPYILITGTEKTE